MNVSYKPLRNTNNVEVTHISNNIKPKNSTNASRSSLNTSIAPMAKSETDDEADDREVVTKPYPGVDDGFFHDTGKNSGNNPDAENEDPDVEVISTKPRDPEPIEPTDDTPTVFNRADPGDGDDIDGTNKKDPDSTTDEKHDPVDGNSGDPFEPVTPVSRRRRPSHIPDYDFDVETGDAPGEYPESIPDVNIYQQKKTLAQGMMDLALFSANANQLRYVLESYNRHPYFYPSIVFISISLILQVAVGIGLIWNGTYNVKDRKQICKANKINNFTVIGIFLVTVVNVFISAFGVANPPA